MILLEYKIKLDCLVRLGVELKKKSLANAGDLVVRKLNLLRNLSEIRTNRPNSGH